MHGTQVTHFAAGLTLLCGAWTLGCSKEEAPPPPPQKSAVSFVEEEEAEAPLITTAHFEALLYDMTYINVRDLLGRESDGIEKEYIPGRGTYGRTELRVWHTWRNPDDSALRAGFVSDRLFEKTPLDLPEAEEEQ